MPVCDPAEDGARRGRGLGSPGPLPTEGLSLDLLSPLDKETKLLKENGSFPTKVDLRPNSERRVGLWGSSGWHSCDS